MLCDNCQNIQLRLFIVYMVYTLFLVFRSLVKVMKTGMMKTAGVRKRKIRTHSLTWMSLCFTRAPATCYQPCASWLYSTPSSPSFVWSGTTVSRQGYSQHQLASIKLRIISLQMIPLLYVLQLQVLLISMFCLQVPLVVFKREKEIARKLEFDGLYITEQPSDDDIKGQWDRLVINTP